MTRWERALAAAYAFAEVWHACVRTGMQLTKELWKDSSQSSRPMVDPDEGPVPAWGENAGVFVAPDNGLLARINARVDALEKAAALRWGDYADHLRKDRTR